MKKFLIIFLLFLFSMYCKTMEETIISKEREYNQTENFQKQEEIIQEMYKKKDQVPENLKDEYIDFFLSKDSESSRKIVIDLYKDPEYKNQRNRILDYYLNHIDENNIVFLKEEINQNPELYTLSVKEKLIALGTKDSAEIILNQIYLGREELDGEILYLFRKTQFTDSLPIIIKSIENQKFVEEGFLTISDFRVEEADLFLINVSSDWSHPHRELAVAYLYKIDNKPLAISIYKDILNNQIDQKNLVLKSLNGLEKAFDYFSENDKKEIGQLLPKIKKKYPDFALGKLDLLKNYETKSQTEETVVTELKDKKNGKLNQEKIPEETHQKKTEEKKSLDEAKKEELRKKEQEQKLEEKQKVKEQIKDNRYVQNLEKKFYGIFKEDSKEIMTNIHNSLLSYSSSNSEKAKFIVKAYQSCYKISEEEKIRNFLKEGLFLRNSFSCILNFIDNQYRREDQKIFAFQEFFVLKRKHSEMIIKHKSKLK